MKTLAPILVWSLALGTGVTAQEATSQGFVLEAGDHDISDVVDRAAKFLGRNLILQDSEVRASKTSPTIHLQKTLHLDVLGCEEVVSQFAWVKGLVMSPVDPMRGIYEFIHVRGSRRSEIRPTFMKPDKILRRPQLKIVVSTVVRLTHLDALQAAQNLRPFCASSSRSGVPLTIGTLGTRHGMMLQGMADAVANAIEMVQVMDTPGTEIVPGIGEQVRNMAAGRAALRKELAALRQRVLALEAEKKRK